MNLANEKHLLFIDKKNVLRDATDSYQSTAQLQAVFIDELNFEVIFSEVVKQQAQHVTVNLNNLSLKFNLSLFEKLKENIPDLNIHIYTADCLFEQVAFYLQKKLITSCQFGVSNEVLYELIKAPNLYFQNKRVFFDNEQFMYKSFLTESIKIQDTLLVLMPAWNNSYPPYGLAHIAGALNSSNINCDILDLNNRFWTTVNQQADNRKTLYENLVNWNVSDMYYKNINQEINFIFDELLKRLSLKTQYIGFSVFATNQVTTQEAVLRIKKQFPHIKVFVGGPQCTEPVGRELIERYGVDAVVIGEGEATVIELINHWRANENLSTPIKGALINKDGKAIQGVSRELLDLSQLPLPVFDLFPLYSYERRASLPIYSSRGCVAKCSFCSETIFWKKFRAISPERIVQMMQDCIFKFGINHFYFNDSLMNGSHKLLEDTCNLIIEKSLNVEFSGYARFDQKLKPELLNKMAKAGCKNISFGFESGSQKIVDLMNKKVYVDNYESILATAAQAGIECNVCIIVGFPGETWRDFFETLTKTIRMRKFITQINLSIMEISKNSLIENDFEKYGIVYNQGRYWRTKNWTNFYLLRFLRYIIFEFTWKLYTGKRVSIGNWDAGYLMLFKKIKHWFLVKISYE